MRRETLGGLEALVGGGPDGAGGGDGPLLVLLHGFGAPGDDLAPLADALGADRAVRFVLPAAPLALPSGWGGGRAWWMIDVARLERALAAGEPRALRRERPEGLAAARARLVAMLDDVDRLLGPPGARLLLGGFSQGAMLACDVALHTDRPLGGLALLSGTLLCEEEWRPRMAARRGLKVVQSHGRADPLLPFVVAEELAILLAEAGLEVDWVPFQGGHEIPPPAVARLAALAARLGG